MFWIQYPVDCWKVKFPSKFCSLDLTIDPSLFCWASQWHWTFEWRGEGDDHEIFDVWKSYKLLDEKWGKTRETNIYIYNHKYIYNYKYYQQEYAYAYAYIMQEGRKDRMSRLQCYIKDWLLGVNLVTCFFTGNDIYSFLVTTKQKKI